MQYHVLGLTAAIAMLALHATEKDPIKKELTRFQGTWQLVSERSGNKATPEEGVKKVRVVITGDTHSVFFGDKVVAKKVRFKIDPSKSPRTVDDLLDDGKVIRGIYELKGDTLKSCVAFPGEARPKDFTAPVGSRHILRIFKRVQP
jgi:uncharacterized protein (TIGR03067 family)